MTQRELTRFTPYILGHDELDAEHFAIYSALEAMWKTIPPDAIPQLMEDARQACNRHFKHEHELMLEADYPFLDSHLEVHANTLGKFYDIINHPTTEKLGDLVDDLLYHIDMYDRLFVQWLNESKCRRCTDQHDHQAAA